MLDEEKKTPEDKKSSPMSLFKDPGFWVGAASGLLVLILGLILSNKLANTNFEVDVSSDGFKLGLIFIANYIAAYAPIMGIVGIIFNLVGLKIKTKLLKILNYAIISIAFLELLLLFGT